MTRLVPVACAIVVGASLSACGGGGAPFQSFADDTSDTFIAKVSDGGVSGRAALQDTSAGGTRTLPFRVELSSDFQTATVTLGSTVYVLPASPGGSGAANGGSYSDGDVTVEFIIPPIIADTYSTNAVTFLNSATGEFGQVVAGAETRPENLPSGSASYGGAWQIGEFNTVGGFSGVESGSIAASVSFDAPNSQVSVDFRDGASALVGNLIATIDGNGFSGTLAYDDTTLSGDLAVTATFFGPAAEQLAGTLDGSLSNGGSDTDVVGTLFGDQIP